LIKNPTASVKVIAPLINFVRHLINKTSGQINGVDWQINEEG